MTSQYYVGLDKSQQNTTVAMGAAQAGFNQLKNNIRDSNQLQLLHNLMDQSDLLKPLLAANYIRRDVLA